MSTGKYILKVLATHLIAAAIMIFMMITLILIFQEQMWYQVLISFALAAFYWFFMGYSLEKYALFDAKNGKFNFMKVIIPAIIINIPNILFLALDLFEGTFPETSDIYKLFFRYWNAGYLNFIILLKDSLWIRILVMILYFPGLCIAYYRGMYLKKKTEATINSMKEEAKKKHRTDISVSNDKDY